MKENVPMLDEIAGKNTKEVIDALNETIRKQQAEIEALKQVLWRYVKEVPLGNQPHMLAHIALELVNG